MDRRISTSAGVMAPTRHSTIVSPAGANGLCALLDRQADDRTPSWKRCSTRMNGPSALAIDDRDVATFIADETCPLQGARRS